MVVQTAVVGAGTVSRTHLSGIQKNPRAELIGLCDTNGSAANARAREYGTVAVTDLDRLFEMEPDALHVCTPVQTHFDIASQAIENGIATILEKPATVTVDELEELDELADSNDVPLTVVHNHLFYPSVRRARELIDAGELGDLRGVDTIYAGITRPDSVKRGSWVFDLPGGEFEEALPHPIYSTLGIGGFPERADDISAQTACSREYDGGFSYDQAQIQFTSADGTLCTTKMLSETKPQRMHVINGSEGSLIVDEINQSVYRIEDDYTTSPIARSKKGLDLSLSQLSSTVENATMMASSRIDGGWEREAKLNSHYAIFDQFSRAVETGSEVPVPVEQSKWTIQAMEAIRNAAEGDDIPEQEQSVAVGH
ncbi:gfo/Idh/MocA family oxidoreductase [Natrarchaeobius halalkaliphilus]|uniref:Gfo/Idh/MocA family oxidoreductase n=1 Tax=Natrarchaeobius halalkaliphilus TaxID=1679091 RepID=A0A3N6NZ51_9EURY|nr:Gfo/Idh/MocA family oxidoreductase [Natrarchaeobius halalkaliphilus]RQG90179.1 gfo/Idh/MocA family oxidoreductase [Natrarchaeobius halalkaliphilus]